MPEGEAGRDCRLGSAAFRIDDDDRAGESRRWQLPSRRLALSVPSTWQGCCDNASQRTFPPTSQTNRTRYLFDAQ